MAMSTTRAIGFALIPGAAESLEREATYAGNMAWAGMAKGVKYARNVLYLTVALTTIAAIGAVLSASMIGQYGCATIAALGVVLMIKAAKKLYDKTTFLQWMIKLQNQSAEPLISYR